MTAEVAIATTPMVKKEKKSKKSKKEGAVKRTAEEAEIEVAAEPAKKKKKKSAAVEAEPAAMEVDEPAAEMSPEGEKKKKKKKKTAAAAEEEVAAPVEEKVEEKVEEEKKEESEAEEKVEEEEKKSEEVLSIFIGGLPFSATEETVKKDFGECGEIVSFRMPVDWEGKPKGIAFCDFATAEAVEKSLAYNETDYGGRTIYVRKEEAKGGKKGKKGDGKKGGKKGALREPGEKPDGCMSVIVKNLKWGTTDDDVRTMFEECGEISRVNGLKDDNGDFKGIFFIDFSGEDAVDVAIKKCNEEHNGRLMFVDYAGGKKEGGKDGKKGGKDGKGKGKKGKKGGKDGKGKGKKGKSVVSTGVAKSFDSDSD